MILKKKDYYLFVPVVADYSDNMKIAYISPSFPPILAGMGTACFYTANKIGEKYEVSIFLADRKVKYQTGNYKIKLFKPWFSFGYADFAPQLFWRLKNFDIIHIYYPYFGVVEFLCFFKKIFFKKSLRIIFHYQMDMVGKGISRFVNYWYKKIVAPFLFWCSDLVFVLSDDYAKNSDIKKYYLHWPEKFEVVPNGVDIFMFCHPEPRQRCACRGEGSHGLSTDKIIFTAQALDRQHFFKGIDVLIGAIEIINRPDVKLVIAGDGDLKEYYENLVNKLCVQDRVKFLGNIDHKNLPVYYQASDVVAVPSVQKTESFSITAAEAMASGKPVVVSDLPGLRVTAENNVSCLLVKPGDAKDLAEKILFFVNNPEKAIEFGQAGRKRAEELYDWDKICERVEKYYSNL